MLTEEDSRTLATYIVQELVKAAQNEKNVEQIVAVWGRHVDQWLGRSVRRVIVYLIIVIVSLGAVKFQAWNIFH